MARNEMNRAYDIAREFLECQRTAPLDALHAENAEILARYVVRAELRRQFNDAGDRRDTQHMTAIEADAKSLGIETDDW